MTSNDDAPQPAPADGGSSNRGNGLTVSPGFAGDPPPSDSGFVFIGDYQLLQKIGETSLTVVFQARDRHRARTLAIHLLKIKLVEPEADRFVSRVTRVARLCHPNIVPIFNLDQYDGLFYLVMPYLTGCTFAGLGVNKPLAPSAEPDTS